MPLDPASWLRPGVALRFGEAELSYAELAGVADALGRRLAGLDRVALVAEPRIETAVAVAACLNAGITVVPMNPKLGSLELRHELADSRPGALLCAADAEPAQELADLPRIDIPAGADAGGAGSFGDPGAPSGSAARPGRELPDTAPAIILYTSGTTGMPKGVVLSRGAIATNLDALAEAWRWTERDIVVQSLPLFHAHGLILGIVGTLRRGGTAHHLGHFDPGATGAALAAAESGVLFAVPTMYHRLADACERDPGLARQVGSARLLVSGSAALPAREHERIARLTGHQVVERYGLSETLMLCSTRVDGERRPGFVGPPLPGVELRLSDDSGHPIEELDGETIGEIEVRTPSLFDGYLNRPEATAKAMRDGWFRTGDMAVRTADGFVRIVGRRATDLIKTGGYRVGAGEVEAALLEHEGVAEAAVLGLPDPDLGQRITAWVVLHPGVELKAEELIAHCRELLSSHKRPREVHFTAALPRNALGKVQKAKLAPA